MSKLLSYKGKFPTLHESVFVCEGAVIVGDVEIGEESSIWFNAVVRGDVCPIRIGKRTNVQDNATLHVTHDTGPLTIGDNVTIGHNAVLHACTVNDFTLIGMGAILLDGSTVEPYSLVAAGAVVRAGFVVPSGMMVAGIPAKVIRPLTPGERQTVETSPQNYINYVRAYRGQEVLETEPLASKNQR
jgi:gamma-carbonic anhydrase